MSGRFEPAFLHRIAQWCGAILLLSGCAALAIWGIGMNPWSGDFSQDLAVQTVVGIVVSIGLAIAANWMIQQETRGLRRLGVALFIVDLLALGAWAVVIQRPGGLWWGASGRAVLLVSGIAAVAAWLVWRRGRLRGR